jgi:hypothetical protein
MKRNAVLIFVGIAIVVLMIGIMIMWPRKVSESDPLQDMSEYREVPAVEEAAFTPLSDLYVSDADEAEEREEETDVDETPETFHDLVDDLSGSDNDDTLQFKEEEWETVEGDPDTVPPIFRIAPVE